LLWKQVRGEVEAFARLAEPLFNRRRSLAKMLRIGLRFFSLPFRGPELAQISGVPDPA
jgi:hypothetical protein